jgi:Fe-S oxidoreductase
VKAVVLPLRESCWVCDALKETCPYDRDAVVARVRALRAFYATTPYDKALAAMMGLEDGPPESGLSMRAIAYREYGV